MTMPPSEESAQVVSNDISAKSTDDEQSVTPQKSPDPTPEPTAPIIASNSEPVVAENIPESDPVPEKPEQPLVVAPVPQAEPTPEEPAAKESTVSYVGSSDSDKFHKPSCRHAQKITNSNKVSFSSKEDAANAGYVACKVCKP